MIAPSDRAFRNREDVKKSQRKQLSEVQDIAQGFCPLVQMSYYDLLMKGPDDSVRRDECKYDLLKFCKTYGAETFPLPWSQIHIDAAKRIQDAILDGGKQAFSMPRGTGKTSLCRWAVKWACSYQHTLYTTLICATDNSATKQLKNIRTVMKGNVELLLDFPEVYSAIWHIEGEQKRAPGQKFFGQETLLVLNKNAICLPVLDIKNQTVENVVIDVAGLTGEIRGRAFVMANGKTLRPTFALVDDPQTRESAKSEQQVKDRLDILYGDIGYLGAPDRPCSIVIPCTVIREGDVADTILDRKKSPEYRGIRVKLVESFPKNMKLWEEYYDIRKTAFELDQKDQPDTEFYRQHYEEMNAGAVVSWQDRFFEKEGELSAIQHAMNLFFANKEAFFAEYQNDPRAGEEEASGVLKASQIAAKVNNLDRFIVPDSCHSLVAAIDVQERLLYWEVMGFDKYFGGSVVAYGTWPELRKTYFKYSEIRKTTLASKYAEYLAKNNYQPSDSEAGGIAGALTHGLTTLVDYLMTPGRFRRENGSEVSIDRGLVDSGHWTDVIYSWNKHSPHRSVWWPSKGMSIKASDQPINEWKLQNGEKRWLGCVYKQPEKRSLRILILDTNYYKTFSHERLSTAPGERGSVSLFGNPMSATHGMFAEHLTSEAFKDIHYEAKGRTVREWRSGSSKPDNHLFDTHVYCHAAAATLGITPYGSDDKTYVRKKINMSDWIRKKP